MQKLVLTVRKSLIKKKKNQQQNHEQTPGDSGEKYVEKSYTYQIVTSST